MSKIYNSYHGGFGAVVSSVAVLVHIMVVVIAVTVIFADSQVLQTND